MCLHSPGIGQRITISSHTRQSAFTGQTKAKHPINPLCAVCITKALKFNAGEQYGVPFNCFEHAAVRSD